MRPWRFALGLIGLCGLAALSMPAEGFVGTAFTYQGEIKSGGTPVTAPDADIRIRPWDSAVGGLPLAGAVTHLAVPLSAGTFSVDLDFGAIFSGADVYLEIEVAVPAGGGFVPLAPRQLVMPTPYAMHATDLANGGLGASYTAPVSFTNAGNSFTGSHTGNGSGLTSLNASNLSSGVLPSGRLSGAYANVLNLTNAANTYNGTFTGSGAGLTNINASNITSGTLSDARLSSNVALKNAANIFTQNQTVHKASPYLVLRGTTGSPGWLRFHDSAGVRQGYVAYNYTLNNLYIGNDGGDGVHEIIMASDGDTSFAGDITTSSGSIAAGTSAPEARLQVSTGTFVSGTDGGFFQVGTDAGNAVRLDSNEVQATLGAATSTLFLNWWGGDINMGSFGSDNVYMAGGGNFGLGTASPTQKYHQTTGNMQLDGGGYIDLNQIDGTNGVFIDGDSGGAGWMALYQNDGSYGVYIDGDASTDTGGLMYIYDAGGSANITLDGEFAGAGYIAVDQVDGTSGVIIDGDGGTDAGGEIQVHNPSGADRVIIDIEDPGTATEGGYIRLMDNTGATTIQLRGGYDDGTVDGRIITEELQITGGSDLSEQFNVAANGVEPEPGMVVSIDAHNPGELIVSAKAYDRTVAGIISGAGGIETGLYMGQDDSEADGAHPVALTGRVYVYCDASYGAIQPGDMLTTCDVPGHAMKVADHGAAQGAIIGKAMTSLEEGRGLVLVLVSLQ